MPLVLNGVMNPRMAEVDVIQDPDLNKNIKYYCEDIISENEDLLIDLIQTRIQNLKYKLCHQETEYCRGGVEPEPVHEELQIGGKMETKKGLSQIEKKKT